MVWSRLFSFALLSLCVTGCFSYVLLWALERIFGFRNPDLVLMLQKMVWFSFLYLFWGSSFCLTGSIGIMGVFIIRAFF